MSDSQHDVTCVEVLEDTTGPIADLDCGEPDNPDLGKDICAVTHKEMNGFGEDTDKPTSYFLTLGPLSDALVTSDSTGKVVEKVEVGAVLGADADGSYYVVVSSESDPAKASADSDAYFSGDVAEGDTFEASGSFGSETFVHIYASDGGALLQSINYHTSCSSPLIVGDEYGSITLSGAKLVGKDTGTTYTVGGAMGSADEGVTYAIVGGADESLFDIDAATGEISFKSAPDFESPTDADQNNKYVVEVECRDESGALIETKTFEFCVQDDCIRVEEGVNGVVADLNCGEEENPDVGLLLCAERDRLSDAGVNVGKIGSVTLTLGDALTTETNTDQGGKLEVGPLLGAENGDGMLRVRVSGSDKPGDLSTIYFDGEVGFGESFTALASAAGDLEFGANTYVHIFDDDGTTLLQTIDFHTSCSAPIAIGDQYGSVSLVAGALVDKDTGGLIEYGVSKAPGDAGVTYFIEGGPDAGLFTIDSETGEVSFVIPPDFEHPEDSNGDNKYVVEVECRDESGALIDTKTLEFCVEDGDCISVAENTTGPIADLDCGEPDNPDLGKDICAVTHKEMNGFGEDTDKPTSYFLTLGPLSDALVTSDSTGKVVEKVEVGAVLGADSDGSYYVVVSSESDPAKASADSDAYFSGDVAEGDTFEASGSFGSETFVHIYASDGGALLQSINYHTSCSSPLIVGDEYGSITLSGAKLVGKDTGTTYTVGGAMGSADEGVMYAIAGGVDADDFIVNPDTGEVFFKQTPDFERPTDSDGDNIYEVVVSCTDLETGAVAYERLEFCVEDDGCINVTEGRATTVDLDLTAECRDDTGLDLCAERDRLKDEGSDPSKIAQLKLTLADDITAGVDFFNDGGPNQADKAKVTTNVASDPDGTAFVIVSKEGDVKKAIEKFLDPSKGVNGKETFFGGSVNYGEDFVANAENEFAADTYVYIFDEKPTFKEAPALQSIKFHTSCSAPIVIGDRYGSVELTGASFRDKDTGELFSYENGAGIVNEAGGDLIYSVVDGPQSGFFTVDPDTGVVAFTAPDYVPGGSNSYEVTIRASVDGDPDCFTEQVVCFDVNPGAALGDKVFFDVNRNGIQDVGEAGVSGVIVTLIGGGADGVIGTADDTVAHDVTDDEGEYLFEGLDPGVEYQVVFSDLPEGFGFTDADRGGDDARDSDADPADGTTDVVTLAPGERNLTVDAGIVSLVGALSGRYFCDTNDNDVDDGQAKDPGIAGVLVELLDFDGKPTGITTETGAEGEYIFSGLAPGSYGVRFTDPWKVLTGKQLVRPNVGDDDAIDSDAQGDTTLSEILGIVVEAGKETGDNDAGAEYTASLGDYVWLDADRDGVQDADEVGVEGVLVTLTGGGADGMVGTADDTTATTTTDENGLYLFEDLDPGQEYKVTFAAPAGFRFTAANAGPDDADSDADQLTGMSQVVTLDPGEFDDSLDAGLVALPTMADDEAKVCADSSVAIDVLANDAPGAALTVTSITDAGADGVLGTADDVTSAIAEGGEVTLSSGAKVTLSGGSLTYDANAAFDGLVIGDKAQDAFLYHVDDDLTDAIGTVGEARVDVDICGALNTIETLASQLTNDTVCFEIQVGAVSDNVEAWTLRISGFVDADGNPTVGDASLLGEYFEAYCISADETISAGLAPSYGPTVKGNLYFADAGQVPAGVLPDKIGSNGQAAIDNLDLINWILNQDFGSIDSGTYDNGVGADCEPAAPNVSGVTYTDAEIQAAIWGLTDDNFKFDFGGGSVENAMEIAEAAAACGEGFVPGTGQKIGLIIDPIEGSSAIDEQPFIIAVDYDNYALECIC